MTLSEIKASAIDKKSQGDVNIYLLNHHPDLKTEKHENPILVTGQTGHHHRLVGDGFTMGKTPEGQFLVEVTGNKVQFAHEEHKPPIPLKAGIYLFDRAREKEMFGDMVGPIQD